MSQLNYILNGASAEKLKEAEYHQVSSSVILGFSVMSNVLHLLLNPFMGDYLRSTTGLLFISLGALFCLKALKERQTYTGLGINAFKFHFLTLLCWGYPPLIACLMHLVINIQF